MFRLPDSLWIKWLTAFLILLGLTLVAHPILQHARQEAIQNQSCKP